ncbi:uncharacterized protein FPRO_10043 [Fusarium proliferatum ET1]|uniref:F-box domain-containing protein n=1 Tax=Fusarium proliferatum (strain ET1) TaxID=1227346 RepID=A0A1L7VSG1_FUSPR|nr:uncharacterized protein FPRO_10043 [Fusarium proliferatum ET1]CZR42740.1 uncharacterized protein FPRO_10043 [Fusarium proliferatum ET1]
MPEIRCFRLQHHHSLPWALRQLYRFRPMTDMSPVAHFDNNESSTCLLASSGQEHGETTTSLGALASQRSPAQTSVLLHLPRELLVQIMIHLPYSSLYMVHQTCGIFRHLLGGFEFKYFRLEMLRSNEEAHCITKAGFDELYIVKRLLRRRSLCDPCGKLFDSGELEEKLKALWKPVLCTGCKKHHPGLLFPQGQRTENRCVGLLGHFAVCKHLKISAKSKLMPFAKMVKREDESITCGHPDHISVYDINGNSTSRYIREPFMRYSTYIAGMCSTYFRSFPMIKIHRQQDLDMSKLKSRLFKQLQDMNGDGLCLHASGQLESIASCITLDKNRCSPGLHNGQFHYECPDWSYGCHHCHQCGARYFWFFDDDCVIFYVWIPMCYNGPDSMSWLSNLTFDADEHPILNKGTQNVLWCSDPSCGTGCGERWLLMMEIFKRHTVSYLLHDWELSFRYTTCMDRLPLTLEYQILQDVAYWSQLS